MRWGGSGLTTAFGKKALDIPVKEAEWDITIPNMNGKAACAH